MKSKPKIMYDITDTDRDEISNIREQISSLSEELYDMGMSADFAYDKDTIVHIMNNSLKPKVEKIQHKIEQFRQRMLMEVGYRDKRSK